MAPTKPKLRKQKANARDRARAKKPVANPRELLANATALLEVGDAEGAARAARAAYDHMGDIGQHAGAVLSLLGQIYIELGKTARPRESLTAAVRADESGTLP